jgi:hypothetical protein
LWEEVVHISLLFPGLGQPLESQDRAPKAEEVAALYHTVPLRVSASPVMRNGSREGTFSGVN